MKKNFKLKAEETLKDFKCLLSRYREVKDDIVLLKMFMNRNRNPIWDLSNNKELKTGLKSKLLIQTSEKGVDDHFIQRVRAMSLIFLELDINPNMSTEDFINILKKYSSTVKLTKEEHKKVTTLSRYRNEYNYQLYDELGIEVDGIEDFFNGDDIYIKNKI